MADITRVSERGQTAIPARLRREHRVEPGTELVWEAIGPDEWRVHISREPPQAPNPAAMRGFARRFRAVRTTSEWLGDLREGEMDEASQDDLE